MAESILVETCDNIFQIFKGLLEKKVDWKDIGWIRRDHPTPIDVENERLLYSKIVATILEVNGNMISPWTIHAKIIVELLGKLLFNPHSILDEESVRREIQTTIQVLLGYKAQRLVDLPILNLRVDIKEIHLGPVSFHSIDDSDKESEWWEMIGQYEDYSGYRVLAYCRVDAPGDKFIAIDYSGNLIQHYLCTFPTE